MPPEDVQQNDPNKTTYEDAQTVLGGGGSPPPPVTPPVASPPVTPPASATPPAPPSPEKVEGAGGNTLEGKALTERLERERKKALKDEYGTDDPTEIQRIKEQRKANDDELAKLRRREEARKRSLLTEEQRRVQDLAQKDKRIQELESQLTTFKQGQLVEQQDKIITTTAAKYVKPEFLKYAQRDLAEHIEKLAKDDPAALKKFTPAKLDSWLKKYAEDNTVFALPPAPDPNAPTEVKPPPAPAAPPRQRTITTANPPPKAKPAPTTGAGSTEKTPIPGRPNSMNAKELNEYYKSKGMRKPY